ncbi:MAG: tRNA pseudouridine(55) synthase TruB [Planctomycetota bacterium]|jgi:tRNA pseudouridine55 synthase|nr:MAG: tRNA pseudouridine(55) synthase TruB [Planctomycetota bacterium]
MFGLLNVNKPASWTSRDVVDRLGYKVRRVKVGHSGTLDPLATGVLVICLGRATRLVPYLHRLPKTYVATFQLGRRSDSDDIETEVEVLPDAPQVTTAQLREVLPRFVGKITQLPPTYSAVKINGKPAYRKARKGKPVEVPEREVEVHRIELLEHVGDLFTLEIECGTGTYIRSIGRDIAAACGTAAVMTSLCRTRVGDFTVETAINPEKADRRMIQEHLIPATRAVPDVQRIMLTADDVPRVENGNEIPFSEATGELSGEVLLCDPSGELVAIAEVDTERRLICPRVVLRIPPEVNRIG